MCVYKRYMATAEIGNTTPVRINDLDWEILSVMADGRRYTPKHLYADVAELDEYGDDWIRRRVMELNDKGLVERVGTSSMYRISSWGEAALEIKSEGEADVPPKELTEKVMTRANQSEQPD